MELSQPVILKRDALGRMQYSAEQRTAMLDEFERSGLSGAAFARRVGVHYQTFASWAQKRRLAQGGYQMRAANVAAPHPSRAPVRLLEAVAAQVEPPIAARRMAATLPGEALCVQLPCGVRLLVGDAGQAVLAARLIHALNSAMPC